MIMPTPKWSSGCTATAFLAALVVVGLGVGAVIALVTLIFAS